MKVVFVQSQTLRSVILVLVKIAHLNSLYILMIKLCQNINY